MFPVYVWCDKNKKLPQVEISANIRKAGLLASRSMFPDEMQT